MSDVIKLIASQGFIVKKARPVTRTISVETARSLQALQSVPGIKSAEKKQTVIKATERK